MKKLIDEISARPVAAARANAIKDKHKFKTEFDEEQPRRPCSGTWPCRWRTQTCYLRAGIQGYNRKVSNLLISVRRGTSEHGSRLR